MIESLSEAHQKIDDELEALLSKVHINDFREWEKNPITKIVKLLLIEKRLQLSYLMSSGNILDRENIEAAYAETVGVIKGLDEVLTLDADQFKTLIKGDDNDGITS